MIVVAGTNQYGMDRIQDLGLNPSLCSIATRKEQLYGIPRGTPVVIGHFNFHDEAYGELMDIIKEREFVILRGAE